MLDARQEVFLQGAGIRRTTHGSGVAPDRTPVCGGGARQDTVAAGRAKAGIATARIGAAARKTPPVSTEVAAGGSAQESIRRSRALCAESVGGVDALSGR